MKLSKADLAEAAVTIYDEMLLGSSDVDIMDLLGYDATTYAIARRFMLECKSEELRNKPREHVYVEYCAEQERNSRDLTSLINNLDGKNQYNAIVGAIRVRSEIADRIIARGQEFGVIKKEAERKEIIGGVVFAGMSLPELKKCIVGEMAEMTSMVAKFGDSSLLELPAPPLHYGEPAPVEVVEVTEGVEIIPKKSSKKKKKKTNVKAAVKVI